MHEEWKKVPAAPRYSVSNCGRVRNDETGRMLKHLDTACGLFRVFLYSGTTRRHVLVHRLVAELFVPNPDGLTEVRYINGDKTDLKAGNLEWADHHAAKPVKAVFPSGGVVKYRSRHAVYKAIGVYHDRLKKSLDKGNTLKGVVLTSVEKVKSNN